MKRTREQCVTRADPRSFPETILPEAYQQAWAELDEHILRLCVILSVCSYAKKYAVWALALPYFLSWGR